MRKVTYKVGTTYCDNYQSALNEKANTGNTIQTILKEIPEPLNTFGVGVVACNKQDYKEVGV